VKLNDDIVRAKAAAVEVFGVEGAKQLFEATIAFAVFSVMCLCGAKLDIDSNSYRIKLPEDAKDDAVLLCRADTIFVNVLAKIIVEGANVGNEV
jgi:hypothetical protein